MAYANDNDTHISGKETHSWPALTRAISKDEFEFADVLRRFSRLYEIANTEPGAIASAAGFYKGDGELALADLVDEVPSDEDGEAAHNGYQADWCVEYGPSADRLYEIACAGAFTTIAPNGKPGGQRNPNFRIRHVFRNQKVDGEITRTFHSWAESRGKTGKWYRLRGETLDRPRGPDRKDDDSLAWTHTVHPSGKTGATYFSCPAEERLDAKQQLDRLRAAIGESAYEVLRMAAVERSTAQKVGEMRGRRHKRASALGTTLIKEALNAANDNWLLAEAV